MTLTGGLWEGMMARIIQGMYSELIKPVIDTLLEHSLTLSHKIGPMLNKKRQKPLKDLEWKTEEVAVAGAKALV